MNNEYNFNDLCEDLRRKLPVNLHATKEGKDFLWIATKYYDIGTYPIHYEIRKERKKVYAEVHYESKQTISLKSNYSDLSTIFQNCCKKIGLKKVSNNTAFYYWYRKEDDGIKFEEGCVEDVLSKLMAIVKLTRKDLINLMNL